MASIDYSGLSIQYQPCRWMIISSFLARTWGWLIPIFRGFFSLLNNFNLGEHGFQLLDDALAPAGRFGQGTHLHIPLSSRPLVSSHVELFWADGFYKTSVTCSMLFSGYDTCVRMSWVDMPGMEIPSNPFPPKEFPLDGTQKWTNPFGSTSISWGSEYKLIPCISPIVKD